MNKQYKKYINANRLAWNEAAPIHEKHTFKQVITNLLDDNYSYIDSIAVELLNEINVADKDVAQLCCNNGRELFSIKRMGAARCIGFDISDGFIKQAEKISKATGIDCEFVRTNITDIPQHYNHKFDVIFISKGTLGWQPDLDRFFGVVSRLLREHGWIFVYEMHPIIDIFWDAERSETPEIRHSYFRDQPFVDYSGLDFFTKTDEHTSAPAYWFHHTMSNVIESCLSQGLAIKKFREYQHDVSLFFAKYENHTNKVPLSYILIASR